MREAAWQAQVAQLARLCGWTIYHPPDNMPRRTRTGFVYVQNTVPGWPDLTLCRAPEMFFAELKTDRGRVDPAQRAWHELLEACGQEVHVWRPRDFDAVHERLRRRQLPRPART